ncbi:MAG: hypothetical protein QXL94_05855 [Candidatus Parvarchaeum sp.]
MDTETYKGNLLIICTPEECFEYHDNPDELLDWLFKVSGDMNFMYNVLYYAGAILKLFTNHLDPESGNFKYKKYDMRYITNKCFEIRDRGRRKRIIRFFDIAQFYEYKPLDETAKIYLV